MTLAKPPFLKSVPDPKVVNPAIPTSRPPTPSIPQSPESSEVEALAPAPRAPHSPNVTARVRGEIERACEADARLSAAWLSDDGTEFVVTGNLSIFDGCLFAATLSQAISTKLHGARGPWIDGSFFPLVTAQRCGLLQIWTRKPVGP